MQYMIAKKFINEQKLFSLGTFSSTGQLTGMVVLGKLVHRNFIKGAIEIYVEQQVSAYGYDKVRKYRHSIL